MFCKSGVIIFVFLCLLGRFNCQEVDENFNQLIHETDWQCDTGCVEAGGQAKSNSGHEFCRCNMDKNIDDTDLLLLQKLAQATGTQLIISEDLYENSNIRKERDINNANLSDKTPKKYLIFQKMRKASSAQKPTSRKPVNNFSQPKKTNRYAINTPKPMNFNAFPKARSSPAKQNLRLKELEDKLDKLRAKFRTTPHLQTRNGFGSTEEKHKSLMEELKQKQNELRLKLKNRISSNETQKVGAVHSEPLKSSFLKKNKLIKSRLAKPEKSEKNDKELIVSPMRDDPVVGKSFGGNSNNDVKKGDTDLIIKAQQRFSSTSSTSTTTTTTTTTTSTTTTTPRPVEHSSAASEQSSSPSEHSSSTVTGSKLKQKFDETKSKLQNLLATPVVSSPQDGQSKVKSKDSSVIMVLQQIKEKHKENAEKIRRKSLPQKNKSEGGQLGAEKVGSGKGDVEGEKKDN